MDQHLWTWSTGPRWTDLRGMPPFRSGPSVPIGRPRSHAGVGLRGDDGAAAARRSNAGKRLRCVKSKSKSMERKRRRRGSLSRGRRGGGNTGDGGPAAAFRGGGAVVREMRKGRARGGEGVLMRLYRVEEGEEARKAVGGGARRGRRRSSLGHHRRWWFGRYGALFATWFVPGARGGDHGAHQGLVDGGGAV
jgi:hypothetical protein